MDFFDVVKARRSVRKYRPTVVPDSVVQKALDSALMAPNSSNLQPWEFYWVRSAEMKKAVVELCLFQETAKSASHFVVAVSRTDTWKRNRDELLRHFPTPTPKKLQYYYNKLIPLLYSHDPFGAYGFMRWIALNIIGISKPVFRGPSFKKDLFEVVTKSTALACENFMLAITAQGYGTCPMEGFDEHRLKKLLKLNSSSHVVMIISVGDIDPEGIFGPQIRVPAEWVVHRI